MKNISEDNLLDIIIETLKDKIQHEVCLFELSSLENTLTMERNVEHKNMAMTTRKSFTNTYRENNVPSSKPPQSLTPQKLDKKEINYYALIVIASIVRDISATRINYST